MNKIITSYRRFSEIATDSLRSMHSRSTNHKQLIISYHICRVTGLIQDFKKKLEKIYIIFPEISPENPMFFPKSIKNASKYPASFWYKAFKVTNLLACLNVRKDSCSENIYRCLQYALKTTN